MSSVYKSVHVLFHVNTRKVIIHTYGIGLHDDIIKYKQSEATAKKI